MNKDIKPIKLSIIMPLYNVEKTLRLALDSVLMQEVDFEYEIIAVDDKSTDGTLLILEQYAKKYKNLNIIKHKTNQGNAVSFYDALSESHGDYFCVLDGDDFYTVKNKLQKQVDFLNGDVKQRYVAVSHKFLTTNEKYEIFDDASIWSGEQDYTYLDFLLQEFYSHTSSYMYRNVFRDKVPEKLKDDLYRGDNPRTFLHMLYTKGKIKQLNFVGSVYFYNGNGIWSKNTEAQQKERNRRMLQEQEKCLSSATEHDIWSAATTKYFFKKSNCEHASWGFVKPDLLLQKLKTNAQHYAFSNIDFIFKQLYKSEYIDSFCESLGFIEMVKHGYSPYHKLKGNKNSILIIVSALTTTGGGVYHEIKDIISMYPSSNVYLLFTDIDNEDSLNDGVKQQLANYNNLVCLYGQSKYENKLSKLFETAINVKPIKIYDYCGHDNTYAVALNQSMLGKNICVFSFDHGFSLGLDNTNYDVYIAKRPTDYEMLNKEYGKKVIFIPCWNSDKILHNNYKAFNKHTNLITACAAARYYKLVSSDGQKSYIDLILELLKITNGKHIHYGPIPEEHLVEIYNEMAALGIDKDKFVNIPWADNLPQSMYDNNVDVFIEPFPIVSYKITLDVLSAGIPVITHDSAKRMGITDFIYSDHMHWKDADDFINVLSNLTAEILNKHSKLSRKYFNDNHSLETLRPYFVQEQHFGTVNSVVCYDNVVVDASNIEDLLYFNLKETTQHMLPRDPGPIEKLRLKHRYKLFWCFLCLLVAQIPVLDLLLKNKTRNKLLNKAEKWFR